MKILDLQPTETDHKHAEWRKAYYKYSETLKPSVARRAVAEQFGVSERQVYDVFRELYGRRN